MGKKSVYKIINPEKYLIGLFTTLEISKKVNGIIKAHPDLEIKTGCFYLETNTNYMLLLSKDMEGLVSDVDAIHQIHESF
ncbi:MAG: hypothetical protein ACFE9C_09505 [Candidatus Hodarchaeota archaeon]